MSAIPHLQLDDDVFDNHTANDKIYTKSIRAVDCRNDRFKSSQFTAPMSAQRHHQSILTVFGVASDNNIPHIVVVGRIAINLHHTHVSALPHTMTQSEVGPMQCALHFTLIQHLNLPHNGIVQEGRKVATRDTASQVRLNIQIGHDTLLNLTWHVHKWVSLAKPHLQKELAPNHGNRATLIKIIDTDALQVLCDTHHLCAQQTMEIRNLRCDIVTLKRHVASSRMFLIQ
mmetsp:Transcript_25399/g.41402  ORF Transcript_25399/g.41402 Transcript_25399/m.41402 type:complete len:229 (+) Transcript_25399:333-1019(+)